MYMRESRKRGRYIWHYEFPCIVFESEEGGGGADIEHCKNDMN